jgi:uncharacterized protein
MFQIYLALAYIIPNIYLFFRIRHLFIGKGYKHWFTLVYLSIVVVFPLLGRFQKPDTNFLLHGLSAISNYLLPFYLYLFLAVLLFDLLLLLNHFVKLVSTETLKRFKFRVYTLSALILLSVAVVIGGAINLNTIRVSKYTIEVPRKNSAIGHLRVAFIADFHIQQNIPLGFVEQFVEKINNLKPDLLLYGGDIVEGDRENKTTAAIEVLLKNIPAKHGVYGVVGNHEFYGGQQQGTFFRKAGIKLLCDTVVRIDSAFYLAGRYDQHFGRRKTIGELTANIPTDLPVILMDHRPTQLQEVSQTAVDVQFSGHTHNGQLFPLNYIIHSMYELSWGYRKIRNTHFFVTSGLRLWGPPVKTAGKSEIMLVDIYFKD